jgi:hypothetical protein
MKLKFIKAQEIDKNVKATVHSSGKLGFSSEAAKKLDLTSNKGILLAINEEENDENLYAKFIPEQNEDSFNIVKAGAYFYVNTKAFLENYGIDYKKNRLIYDIIEFNYEGEKMFKFLKREIKKKSKTENNS